MCSLTKRQLLQILVISLMVHLMALNAEPVFSKEIGSTSTYEGHFGQRPQVVLAIAWSPSGELLAVGRTDGIRLYDVTGQEVNSLETVAIDGLAWSPDSTMLAANQGPYGHVLILQIPSLTIIDTNSQVITTGGTRKAPLSWNPNPNIRVLATGAFDEILFWSTEDWRQIDSIASAHEDEVDVLKWSPDGTKIASGGTDATIHVWNFPSKLHVAALEIRDEVLDINWENNTTLVIPDVGDIIFWDFLADQTSTYNDMSSFYIYDVEISDQILATSTWEKAVVIWDRERDASQFISLESNGGQADIAINPDGKSVTYPGSNGSIVTSEVLPVIAPSNLTAVPIPLDKVRLTWQDNFDTETAFHIEWYLNGSWTEITTVPANQTSYTHVGLVCNKNTQYRVRAYRQSDNEFSPYSTQVYVRADNCGPDKIAVFNMMDTQARLFTTFSFPPRPPDLGYIHYWVGGTHTGQWFMGDWNGDGVDTPAVFNNGTYWYTNTPSATATDWTQINVQANEYPVVGRFDLNIGHDCLGVIDSILFPPDTIVFMLGYTCNLTGGTSPALSFQWLSAILPNPTYTGDYQFASGDWNADGIDTIAARRSEYIAFTNVAPGQNAEFNQAQYFGNPYNGQYPSLYGNLVAGDWNYDGIDTFGYFYADGNLYWRDHLEWNQPISGSTTFPQPFGMYVIPTTWR